MNTTGKSTLIKQMMRHIHITKKMYELLLQEDTAVWRVAVTATTNKAAQVVSDLLEDDVSTIHSFLQLKLVNNFSDGSTSLQPKKTYGMIYDHVILIDEASFISDELFEYIEDTCSRCKIILIGDQYQLAPINQSRSIMETLSCKYRVELTEVMRNKGAILDLGIQFKDTVKTGIFQNIITNSPEIQQLSGIDFKQEINKAFLALDYNAETAKILTWTNDCVLSYNAYIRRIKGYAPDYVVGEQVITNKPISSRYTKYVTDQRVTITEIDGPYDLYKIPVMYIRLNDNIQSTYILPLDQDLVKQLLNRLRKLKEWTKFFEIKNDWLDLRPVYASTIHKSQGSEYDTVFLNLTDTGKCTISTDVARMLYVSITRAKKQVFLYGELPYRYGG